MLKVDIVKYDDLPDSIKHYQPNNGRGRELANYLKIEIPGIDTIYESDAMSPEDASFTRDLMWVKTMLENVYNAGKSIGRYGKVLK